MPLPVNRLALGQPNTRCCGVGSKKIAIQAMAAFRWLRTALFRSRWKLKRSAAHLYHPSNGIIPRVERLNPELHSGESNGSAQIPSPEDLAYQRSPSVSVRRSL